MQRAELYLNEIIGKSRKAKLAEVEEYHFGRDFGHQEEG
jgi:hypothetical protein